jgi:hypothetical protein
MHPDRFLWGVLYLPLLTCCMTLTAPHLYLYRQPAFSWILHSHLVCLSSWNGPSLMPVCPTATPCVSAVHQRLISTSDTTSQENCILLTNPLLLATSGGSVCPGTLLLPQEHPTGTEPADASRLYSVSADHCLYTLLP